MDDIVVAVLKGGEVVVDFAGEIYQSVRGSDDDEDDDKSSDSAE